MYSIFAIFTYILMFFTYVNSKRRLTQPSQHVTVWKIFINSKFSFSMLLIGSYLLLTVIPENIRMIYYHKNINMLWKLYFIILFPLLSSSVDGILYIYMKEPVKDLLKEMCCSCKRGMPSSNASIELGNI